MQDLKVKALSILLHGLEVGLALFVAWCVIRFFGVDSGLSQAVIASVTVLIPKSLRALDNTGVSDYVNNI